MDNGDKATCLLGVDFEKAFNRMDQGHCLRQLKRLGASDKSLRLAASFLKGRTMSNSINGTSGGTRPITRGSPHGSVLGCKSLIDDLGSTIGTGITAGTSDTAGTPVPGGPLRRRDPRLANECGQNRGRQILP